MTSSGCSTDVRDSWTSEPCLSSYSCRSFLHSLAEVAHFALVDAGRSVVRENSVPLTVCHAAHTHLSRSFHSTNRPILASFSFRSVGNRCRFANNQSLPPLFPVYPSRSLLRPALPSPPRPSGQEKSSCTCVDETQLSPQESPYFQTTFMFCLQSVFYFLGLRFQCLNLFVDAAQLEIPLISALKFHWIS